MAWRGRAPDPSGYDDADPIPMGDHPVVIKKVVRKKNGDWLVILADPAGRECLANVPDDIDPNSNPKKAWLFYRMCGAFDHPSEHYWSLPPGEREERTWDVETDLNRIADLKTGATARVGEFNGKASLDDIWSPRRARHESVPEAEIPF